MELWEGAVLIVGGIWLVGYMSRRNQQLAAQPAAGAPSTTVTTAGTSNASNLTTITNTAGGYQTVWGEPLAPPQAPIVKPTGPSFNAPVSTKVPYNPTTGIKGTIARPVASVVASGSNAAAVIPFNSRLARPVDVHL